MQGFQGQLDGLLLAVLQEGPLHGYAIASELRARSGGALEVPEGTLYPVLHKLEREGLVRSHW
jgi:PadR family transcriptional regulator, regulatory protein PadR